MSGPLQVIPKGYLGFFQIKNTGRPPQEAADTLVPVEDLTEWYFVSEAAALQTANVAVAAVGFTAMFSIGASGAFIRSLGFGVSSAAALGAGVTLQGCVAALIDPNGQAAIIPLGPESRAFTVGHQFIAYADRHFFLPPSAQLGIFVTQLAAGPVNMRGHDYRAVLTT